MKNKVLLLLFASIFLIALAGADQYSDCSIYGNCKDKERGNQISNNTIIYQNTTEIDPVWTAIRSNYCATNQSGCNFTGIGGSGGGTINGSGTEWYIAFFNESHTITGNTNLTYNATSRTLKTNRLLIGNNEIPNMTDTSGSVYYPNIAFFNDDDVATNNTGARVITGTKDFNDVNQQFGIFIRSPNTSSMVAGGIILANYQSVSNLPLYTISYGGGTAGFQSPSQIQFWQTPSLRNASEASQRIFMHYSVANAGTGILTFADYNGIGIGTSLSGHNIGFKFTGSPNLVYGVYNQNLTSSWSANTTFRLGFGTSVSSQNYPAWEIIANRGEHGENWTTTAGTRNGTVKEAIYSSGVQKIYSYINASGEKQYYYNLHGLKNITAYDSILTDNLRYLNGSAWNFGGVSSADGNNYTTAISFIVSGTNYTLNLSRNGAVDLLAEIYINGTIVNNSYYLASNPNGYISTTDRTNLSLINETRPFTAHQIFNGSVTLNSNLTINQSNSLIIYNDTTYYKTWNGTCIIEVIRGTLREATCV